MRPKDLIRQWITNFNEANVAALAGMYAEDAVNDQVVFDEPLVGRQAIREMFETEFARAQMICVEETIYECGDTGILQWRDPNGLRGCGFFTFADGLIVHQKGYFDQLTFFRAQGIEVPDQYLG